MTQPLLDIRNLKVRIGAGEHAIRAVDDVSFHINRGETFALLGESGCGKSTILRLLLRLTPPLDSGEIRLFGRPVESWSREEIAARICWVSQRPFVFSGTIADNIAYGRPGASDAEVERVIEAVREALPAAGS